MAETRKSRKPSVKAKRNPAAAGEPLPFAQLDPSYPVKPWVEPKTATTFATVAVRQENGQFIAIIAEHPEFRAVRKTQPEAEAAVKAVFIQELTGPDNPAEASEDAEDIAISLQRDRSDKFTPLDSFLKRHGLKRLAR